MKGPEILQLVATVAATVAAARCVTEATGYRPSPVIFGVQTHHWMFGLGIFALGVSRSSVPMAGIGLGLVVDELDQVFPPLFPSYPPPCADALPLPPCRRSSY